MKKTHIIAAFAAFVLVAQAVFSATKQQEKQFADADSNGDKALSKEEFVMLKVANGQKAAKKNNKEFNEENASKQAANAFAKADTDGDGKLNAG